MNIKDHDGTANFIPGTVLDIHHISAAQLAMLGMEEIAFVKPVMTEQGPAFSIHAADGTPLTVIEQRDIAFATVRQHDLEPASVH